jgi:hypothetical protein
MNNGSVRDPAVVSSLNGSRPRKLPRERRSGQRAGLPDHSRQRAPHGKYLGGWLVAILWKCPFRVDHAQTRSLARLGGPAAFQCPVCGLLESCRPRSPDPSFTRADSSG